MGPSASFPCAAPSYAPGGDILYGGADLTLPGATGYYFDVIYVSIMVQVATVLTDWAWLLFLAVRALQAESLVTNLGAQA